MRKSLVQLYCYDLSGGMAESMSMLLIGQKLDAIWHTAIVVYQKEFYFDGGAGIVQTSPGQTRFGLPKRVEVLGETDKTEAEFYAWTRQQHNSGFGPYDYNILNRNCNHFTQEAARFLVNRDIPDEIRTMVPRILGTPLGQMLRPLLERATTALVNGSEAPPPTTPAAAPPAATKAGLYSTKKQLTEAEEEDLMIALAMLQSNELLSTGSQEGLEITRGAIVILRTSLRNILEQPTEPKYRGLTTNSQIYKTNLLPLENFGVVEILRLSGFRLRQHPSGTGQQWYLSDADGSEDILSIMIAHLNDLMEAVDNEAPSSAPKAETHTCNEKPCDVPEPEPPKELTRFMGDDDALQIIQHDAGQPISSLKELQDWSATEPGPITPAVPCRRRVTDVSRKETRLLVCHDMCGGYNPGDYARFALCDAASSVEAVVDASYTVSYWDLVDYFVYFSHHRVSVPPKEWINAAHREGVPMLGTFISEWDAADMCTMLGSAEEMGNVIRRLVEICDAYNFDGYLINIENRLDKILAGRLVTFVAMLRQTLNKDRPPSSPERTVVWYDAITIDGRLEHQNALTPKNKPFFDVSSGLFTNYRWRPDRLLPSTVLACSRCRDVYVGVDVFGRNGMYQGGGYSSGEAAECADKVMLSVALFAPAWTLEVEGNNSRENFLRCDAKMWFGLQDIFGRKPVEYDTLPLWTCFRSGVGKQFYVNGECVVGGTSRAVEWCQLSQAQFIPCYRFALSLNEGDAWCALPLEGDGDTHRGVVPVEWAKDTVWMGDRSMRFDMPALSSVKLMQSKVSLSGCSNTNGALLFVDVAWWRCQDANECPSFPQLRVRGISANSTQQILLGEANAPGGTSVVATMGNWEIVRYIIPASTNWLYITSVSVVNPLPDKSLRCTLGGVGFLTSDNGEKARSVLLAGQTYKLPADQFSVVTQRPTSRVLELKLPQEGEQRESVLVFADVTTEDGASVRVYMGQHEKKPKMLLELCIADSATVQEVLLCPVASGS